MQLKDFYYSKTIASHMGDISRRDGERKRTLFKGAEYTECIDHGETPVCNCDDAILVGTGRISDITICQ